MPIPRPTRLIAAALAAAIVATGLVSFDTSHVQAAQSADPDPTYSTKVWPDPATRGVYGDLSTAQVILVGDSIANGCGPEIRDGLTASGVTSAIAFWSGRPTKPAIDWALSLSRKPPVLVMEHGSNDWAAPGVMQAEVTRLLDGMPGGTKVLWIDTYNAAKLLAAGWVNQGIYLSGVTVIPWWKWIAQNPARDAAYLRDGLHPTPKPGPGCGFYAAATKGPILQAVAAR